MDLEREREKTLHVFLQFHRREKEKRGSEPARENYVIRVNQRRGRKNDV